MPPRRDACPRCSQPLTGPAGEVPWCPSCRWGLSAYDRRTIPSRWGNRVVDRLTHRLAFWLDGRPPAPGHLGRVLVLGLAALVLALPLLLLGYGGYLILAGAPVIAAFAIVLAFAGRPRLRRKLPPGTWEVPQPAAPTLYAAVERVAAATGAPMPDVIAVSADVNASAGRAGRSRVLVLGLPLWAVLPAQQRVALLGHELGHFVNHDVRSGPVVGTALYTLDTIIDTLGGALLRVVGPLAFVLMSPFYLLFIALLVASRRDGQRAEHLADRIAAEAAGTPAAAAFLDLLLVADTLPSALRGLHRRPDRPADWRAAGTAALRDKDLEELRQRSLRVEASLTATHPPAGRRAQVVGSWSEHPPAVTMSEPEAERTDAELSPWFGRLGS